MKKIIVSYGAGTNSVGLLVGPEERIHGSEVSLAPWYMCSECGQIAHSLLALNVCIDIKENMREVLKEFNRDYAPRGFALKVAGVAQTEEDL